MVGGSTAACWVGAGAGAGVLTTGALTTGAGGVGRRCGRRRLGLGQRGLERWPGRDPIVLDLGHPRQVDLQGRGDARALGVGRLEGEAAERALGAGHEHQVGERLGAELVADLDRPVTVLDHAPLGHLGDRDDQRIALRIDRRRDVERDRRQGQDAGRRDHRWQIGALDRDRHPADDGRAVVVAEQERERAGLAGRPVHRAVGRAGQLRDAQDIADRQVPVADLDGALDRQAADLDRQRIAVGVHRLADPDRGRPGVVEHLQRGQPRQLRRLVRLGRKEVERLGAERVVGAWLLPVGGVLEHRIADLAEQEVELEAGLLDVLEQGGGIGAVRPVAVDRDIARTGREGDHRVARQVVHARHAVADQAGPDRAQHPAQLLGERVVAAGVEDHQAELLRLGDLAHHQVERQGLVEQVALALEGGIDRQQVVLAGDLDAVAGIVDHRHVGLFRLEAEVAQGMLHAELIEIDPEVDVEVGLTQGLGDRFRVVARIGQLLGVLIGRVTDHQRHPLFRCSAVRMADAKAQHDQAHQDL